MSVNTITSRLLGRSKQSALVLFSAGLVSLISSGMASAQASFLTTLNNTATVTAPTGVTDNDNANNSSTLGLGVDHDVNLAVTKTDGTDTYVPGTNDTYTITVTNSGLTRAEDVSVTDALPAGLTYVSHTCTAGGNAVCGTSTTAVGATSFQLDDAILPSDTADNLKIELTVAYASNMTTPSVTNGVSVLDSESTADAKAEDDEANGISITADLAIAKASTDTDYVPGGTGSYTLTVSNAGPSDVTGARIQDSLPNGVTLSAGWTCAVVSNATCPTTNTSAAGDSVVDLLVDIADGGSVTITVPVSFAADAPSYNP